ncbi:MAG: tyrosine-type recombinase/integrase [Acidimicrobiales bacterium]
MADRGYSAATVVHGTNSDAPAGNWLASLLPSWERSLRASRKSDQTIRSYLREARIFAAWLAERGMPTDPTTMRREHVEAFIVAELERPHTQHPDRPISAGTVAGTYRRLQQLFRWLDEEGEITSSPMANMSPPALDEVPVPVIQTDNIRRLLAVCDGSGFTERRDTALVRLFADSGMRLASMAGIELDDIAWDVERVSVLAKGRKHRDLPFGAKTAVALDRYLRTRARHAHARERWLWLGRKGRLSASGIEQMLKRRSDAAGIGHVHPHMFRHTAAHRWLASGGNEGDLMELMGWESRDMLGRYAKSAAEERARDAHRRMALGDEI